MSKIFVDTSKVSGIVAGIHSFSDEIWDSWLYKDIKLDSGKIYGLVSEYHQGCMYLSYLRNRAGILGDLSPR